MPPIVSLSMIVKNGAETLGRCLASARELVGEMVVVDTGSTDDSKAIALALGARVHDFKWSDSFADARVAARLKGMQLLQADVTANTADDRALLARFKLFGPPGMIFFDKAGQESAYRVIGYEPPEKFLQSMDKAMR